MTNDLYVQTHEIFSLRKKLICQKRILNIDNILANENNLNSTGFKYV